MAFPKFSEHIAIFCFVRRYPKQNSVIRLILNIPPPDFFAPPNVWAGYASDCKPFHLTYTVSESQKEQRRHLLQSFNSLHHLLHVVFNHLMR